MATFSAPRIMLSGVGSRIGKSLIGTGLAVAMRKRGLSVAVCAMGPRIHQASLYYRVCGRFPRIFDQHLLSPAMLMQGLYQASLGADIVIIDGRGGLFDGDQLESLVGADAQVAMLTKTPIALVFNAGGMSNSLAALVSGFQSFVSGVNLEAVIGNRLTDERGGLHSEKAEVHARTSYLKDVLINNNLAGCLGVIPEALLDGELPSSNFSQRENQTSIPMNLLLTLGNLVEEYIDIDGLLNIAEQAPSLSLGSTSEEPGKRQCRIAFTDDSCFRVAFQDNLDLLRYYGAELVPFSPLVDSAIPKRVSGLYITGAYLDSYGAELFENRSMTESILNFLDRGGVLYAEGAGAAYLCSEYLPFGRQDRIPGIGAVEGVAISTSETPSYITAELSEYCVLGAEGMTVRGISTGEWRMPPIIGGAGVVPAFKISKDHGGSFEGVSPTAQSVVTSQLLHFGSNPEMAKNIVEAASTVQLD